MPNPEIRIDEAFRRLIPPLADEELAQLEENLLLSGCRDPLVVWERERILLDGHHRYEICTRQGIPFKTTAIRLASRDEAEDWIDANQLGRRNLNPLTMSMLRGRRYNRTKKAEGRPAGKLAQNEPVSTAESLAEKHGVSAATIKRDGVFAKAVEQLKPIIADIETRVATGQIPNKEAVLRAAQEPTKAKSILDVSVHVSHNSGNNQWYTPPEFIEAARKTMGGIDCDPASSAIANRIVRAETFYTPKENGLAQAWGKRVWMNPPYAQPDIGLFSMGLVQRVASGEVKQACVLVNNATETAWCQALLADAACVCFVRGRVRFLDPHGAPSGAPLQGQIVIYFGLRHDAFRASFEPLGVVFAR